MDLEIDLSGLTLNGKLPQAIAVRPCNDEDAKTAKYSIIADYGWAESILASECYYKHAVGIAYLLKSAIPGCKLFTPPKGLDGNSISVSIRDQRPTIAELERILQEEPSGHIQIAPDGSISHTA